VENILIRLESWLFSRGFVVSEELRRELRISDAFVLSPQGAQKPKEIVAKSWSRLRLLYVGTLHNRRLHEFVQGLAIYVSADGIGIIDEFIIIGHGSGSDRQRLVASIEAAGLSIVKFVGEIRHPNLQPFLDRGNVGVSYVPVTPYFNLQPVTKTSEYRLNGMAVLATNTVGNKKVIRDEDGVIHGDNPNAVAQALRELVRRRDLFKSSEIQQRALPECWEEIVSTVVEPAMLSFAKMKDHNS
jgi:glycosyltransferase involved in cell wall biosynthesis